MPGPIPALQSWALWSEEVMGATPEAEGEPAGPFSLVESENLSHCPGQVTGNLIQSDLAWDEP